jgi:GxxExxY protein
VEAVWQRALPIALKARGIESVREVPSAVYFRGQPIGDYRADLIVDGKVIVEMKAMDRILPVHEAQLLNYLKASHLEVGLILNFGPRASFRPLIQSGPPIGSMP